MDRNEAAAKARQAVEHLIEGIILPGQEINDNHTFDEIGIDSLDKVELSMELEELFDIDLSDDELISIERVDQLIEYLTEELIRKK